MPATAAPIEMSAVSARGIALCQRIRRLGRISEAVVVASRATTPSVPTEETRPGACAEETGSGAPAEETGSGAPVEETATASRAPDADDASRILGEEIGSPAPADDPASRLREGITRPKAPGVETRSCFGVWW
jgi:hypothetical protein